MPGHNNWFQVNHKELTEPFKFTYTLPESYNPMPFQAAADYTAICLAEMYSKLHLCFSGGLDSEFVGEVFVRNNIPFVPVILDCEMTKLESSRAFEWCDSKSIEPYVIEYLDNEKLVLDIIRLAHIIQETPDVGIVPMIIDESIPGADLVTGFGDQFVVDDIVGDDVILESHDFYLEANTNHPGAFFTYTPELFFASINDIDRSLHAQTAKSNLYGIPNRPKLRQILDFGRYSYASRHYITPRKNTAWIGNLEDITHT